MRFFNIDCHVSVISDIKNIFENLGHTVDLWSLSGHRWVLNLPSCPSPVINESNWSHLDEEMVDRFYDSHKNDLDKYDAFICAYPPCFLKLFEKFNKPIIVISATRYDHPFGGDPQKLEWLEHSLKNNKNIIKISNNQFDQKYCEKFLNNKWAWIPSLCDYTKSKHNPSKKEFVLFSKDKFQISGLEYIHQSSLGRYTWSDLYSHKGIIHFPYNASTMSIFEQYQAGVPLYFPTLEFALDLIHKNVPIFSELTFPNAPLGRERNIFLTKSWISLSDFYNGTIESLFYDENFTIHEPNPTPPSNKDKIYTLWKDELEGLI